MRPHPSAWLWSTFLSFATCSGLSCRMATAPLPAETQSERFPEVAIQGNWFTVDGEKFLVVGVGYEIGARPGRVPWDRDFQPELLHADFERIVDAGFNTIRTWAPMTDEEMAIAAEYGLWVIMGLWIDAKGDYSDPAFRQEAYAFYERELTRLSKHPNILCYLLLNEPHADTVYHAGKEEVNEFYREIVRIAKRCDPARAVSYSNCVATDWMIPDMFDFVAQNVYPYSPTTIEKALGYRTYLEIMRERLGAGKPMLVTEFGLSVSPAGDGRGYGGNSLEEQRDGVVYLWDEIINAGCAGGCAFMWVDGWWKYGDEHVHDDHAEEWYGLLEADSAYVGQPRPVYIALQEYNRFIPVQPRDGQSCDSEIPVEVWAPHVEAVDARVAGGAWSHFTKSGPWWWRGAIETSSLKDGAHAVEIRAHGADGELTGTKSKTVLVNHAAIEPGAPVRVKLRPLEPIYVGEPIPVEVEVIGLNGEPVGGAPVRVERFVHTAWNEYGLELKTDARGLVWANLAPLQQPGMLSVAAGVPYEVDGQERRAGDYLHTEVRRR